MTDFATVGAAYAAHSRSARGRLRHDLVARRVLAELPARPVRVLDAGCGDGEMLIRLAAAGHRVTGFDPSAEMLGTAARRIASRPGFAGRVRLVNADIGSFPVDGERFDAVCCHGVLMYLEDPAEAVGRLAEMVGPGGLLSLLTKNGAAVGVREAFRGEYETARELIESGTATSVGNLGLPTRGDDVAALDELASGHGLTPLAWQGVRIFHDHTADWRPAPAEYAAALETEWAASSRDPYRQLGRMVHTLARREVAGSTT